MLCDENACNLPFQQVNGYANSEDLDEKAYYEPSQQDLRYLLGCSLRKHAYSNILKN